MNRQKPIVRYIGNDKAKIKNSYKLLFASDIGQVLAIVPSLAKEFTKIRRK